MKALPSSSSVPSTPCQRKRHANLINARARSRGQSEGEIERAETTKTGGGNTIEQGPSILAQRTVRTPRCLVGSSDSLPRYLGS